MNGLYLQCGANVKGLEEVEKLDRNEMYFLSFTEITRDG